MLLNLLDFLWNNASLLLQISAFIIAVDLFFSFIKQHISDFFNDTKINMIIDGSSATLYDNRVSSRSLEVLMINSFPSVKEASIKLLKRNNINPSDRYEKDLVNDAKNRNKLVERYGKHIDKIEKNKKLESFYRILSAVQLVIHSINFILILRVIQLIGI